MSVVDKLVPLPVGQRTELVALGIAIIRLLACVGVVSPEQADGVTGVLTPAAGAFLAAKITRGMPASGS